MRREDCRARTLTDDLKLSDGAGTLKVTGDEEGRVPLILEPLGQLSGQRGLTGTLQSGQHDDRRRSLGELQSTSFAAENLDQFFVDDLDDLLSRVQCTRDLGALGTFLDLGDEATHYGKRYVGLEQGKADLAGRSVDVGAGQTTLATQILERSGQSVGKGFEHRVRS